MAVELFTNRAYSTVANSPLAIGGTTLNLATGHGARFASPTMGQIQKLVLVSDLTDFGAAYEIVYVTARSSDALTITRAQDGTAAAEWPAGTIVIGGWVAGSSGIIPAALPIDAAARASVGSGDLFSGTTLDSGWSSMQSTAVTSVVRSFDGYCILNQNGSTSGQDRGIDRAFSPAGDFTVYAKIPFHTMKANFQWAGIMVGASDPSDAGGGNRLQLIVRTSDGVARMKFAKYAAGVETNVFDADWSSFATYAGLFQWPFWLRIKRVSTTLTAGWSLDGVEFIDHATTTTIAFTVATTGLVIGQNTAADTIRAVFSYIATTG